NRAVVHVQGDHATATAFVHDEVDGKIFDIELRRMAQRLAVHRVQHGVAGAIGGGAGALGGALAVMCGHAAEGTLIDLAIFLAAREWQAPMLQLIHGGRRIAAQIFDSVLVTEPVGTLDGVVHVPAPIILAHVAERRCDAALRGNGVRPSWEDFGNAGRAQASFTTTDYGAQPRTARADHNDVVAVILDRISAAVDRGSAVRFSIRRHVRPRTTA